MAIATLIAAGRLDDRLIDRALGLLREVDPKAAFLHWIDEGDAADLRFSGDFKSARWALHNLAEVDVVVQPEEPRWKRLLVADMDSTIIGQESLDERVEITVGAETLVQTMQAGGSSCLLVSGGFLSFADPIAKAVGFDRVKANRLVFVGGKLSGDVGNPIVDAMAKRDALVEARDQLGLAASDVLAVGDGANDKLMIEEAGLGIAYRAKPALVEVADAELKYHGLEALLWVLGVRRRDWFRG